MVRMDRVGSWTLGVESGICWKVVDWMGCSTDSLQLSLVLVCTVPGIIREQNATRDRWIRQGLGQGGVGLVGMVGLVVEVMVLRDRYCDHEHVHVPPSRLVAF